MSAITKGLDLLCGLVTKDDMVEYDYTNREWNVYFGYRSNDHDTVIVHSRSFPEIVQLVKKHLTERAK